MTVIDGKLTRINFPMALIGGDDLVRYSSFTDRDAFLFEDYGHCSAVLVFM